MFDETYRVFAFYCSTWQDYSSLTQAFILYPIQTQALFKSLGKNTRIVSGRKTAIGSALDVSKVG
jgi:hypothetical protein